MDMCAMGKTQKGPMVLVPVMGTINIEPAKPVVECF